MKVPTLALSVLGIDPGFTGACVVVRADGTPACWWDMPVVTKKTDRQRLLDLPALWGILDMAGDVRVVLELPNCRPHESPNACFRFGQQVGILQGMIHARRLELTEVSPVKWTHDLCCPGKDHPQWVTIRQQRVRELGSESLLAACRGPRGGLKDGRLDAALLGLWGLGRRPKFNGAA